MEERPVVSESLSLFSSTTTLKEKKRKKLIAHRKIFIS
jgi:hypothetical protein